MEPNFFVTESKIICLDGEIIGKSLYISLPFCRVLTTDELASVVGHEMGHFVGDDTLWSRKFYPIYRGSLETLSTLYNSSTSDKEDSGNGLILLAFLPALYFIKFFISSFAKSEKEISRERELNADATGISITSSNIMAMALLKVHAYPHIWQFTQDKMKENFTEGKQIVNISAFFCSVCAMMPTDFMKDTIGVSSSFHPMDSHPPLSERLEFIGIKIPDLYKNGLNVPETNAAIDMIDNNLHIEEDLSDIEYYKLIRSGEITINQNSHENNAPKNKE